MKLKEFTPIVAAAAIMSQPAMAQDTEPHQFAPMVSFVTGMPTHAIQFNKDLGVAADLHVLAGKPLGESPLLHGGVNLGLRYKDTEVKFLGGHTHCEGPEPCEWTYNLEFFHGIDGDWAIGGSLGTNFTNELLTQRLVLAYRGFYVAPQYEYEDGEFEPGLELSAVWGLSENLSIGPLIYFSSSMTGLGLTVWAGSETHP